MEDKRKNNGGWSTKSRKRDDKRLNPFRKQLAEAFTPEDVINVLKTLHVKALDLDSKDGIAAAKIFLEYALGKPKETIKVNLTDEEESPEQLGFQVKQLVEFVKTKDVDQDQ